MDRKGSFPYLCFQTDSSQGSLSRHQTSPSLPPSLLATHEPSAPVAVLIRVAGGVLLAAGRPAVAGEDGVPRSPDAVEGLVVGPVAVPDAPPLAGGEALRHDGGGRGCEGQRHDCCEAAHSEY